MVPPDSLLLRAENLMNADNGSAPQRCCAAKLLTQFSASAPRFVVIAAEAPKTAASCVKCLGIIPEEHLQKQN